MKRGESLHHQLQESMRIMRNLKCTGDWCDSQSGTSGLFMAGNLKNVKKNVK